MTDQVVMPPASLSAAAEMRPGPRIARKMASRLRPMRPTSRRPTLRGDCAIEASSTEDPRQALLPGERKHQIDGIVDGDDSVELALVVNDGQGEQVVLGDHVGDHFFGRRGEHGDRVLRHEVADLLVWRRGEQVAQREHAAQLLGAVDHVDVVDGLYVPVSYTHLRAHETGRNLVCRLLL